ncbi:hypothetical protein ACWDG1_42255, partial [Streptomyces sp. NPDC001177]
MNAPAGPGPTPTSPDTTAPGSAEALDVVLYDYRADKAPLLREAVLPLAHHRRRAGAGARSRAAPADPGTRRGRAAPTARL